MIPVVPDVSLDVLLDVRDVPGADADGALVELLLWTVMLNTPKTNGRLPIHTAATAHVRWSE
ncbi:MAG: hypothetical protein K6T30_03325 [Alicyclobacillus sp.]|nr:hypothetical protein [Alicyclobacillus sp.]